MSRRSDVYPAVVSITAAGEPCFGEPEVSGGKRLNLLENAQQHKTLS
jgi:hypothetical protein